MSGEILTVAGGTYHIVQGGTFGDVVKLELRDVTFLPYMGHTLTIDRAWARQSAASCTPSTD